MDQKTGNEKIVMTPTKKDGKHTILKLERKLESELASNRFVHVAGGNNKGLIINKQLESNGLPPIPPQLSLSFKVFLVNAATSSHTQESRQLRFWFKAGLSENEQMRSAQDLFRSLVNPSEFPRDYVGFIMKVMKLMQHKHIQINQIEIEMKQLEQLEEPPSRPMSVDDSLLGMRTTLTEERVLELIESSYPNPVSLTEITNSTHSSHEEVYFHLQELLAKNIIRAMDNGLFTRVTQTDTEVKLVKQMPKVVRSEQPTIAIITAQYCEKLAVDAMIENKDTYVRYKTEGSSGESNVYTLGNIGWHRVVSTKLPAVGHSRGAMIAAGNTTTRLLGTFQRIEYVFLVGLGGGVPHYTDFNRHVRLGDVVVSVPPAHGTAINKPFVYIHCEKIQTSPNSETPNGDLTPANFSYRTWCPHNLELQEIAEQIWYRGLETGQRTWEDFMDEGADRLQVEETDFTRPPPESDKLYMSIGVKDVIEMGHPVTPTGAYDPRRNGFPMVHFGSVGSGRNVARDEHIRQDIASKFGILAYDSDFDSVAESVFGNRKDKYVFIRGISDYKDGTRKKEWQPYAALSAAAFMKSVIATLSPIDD